MNTFYDAVEINEKERIHFNEFMLKVHKDIHKFHGVIMIKSIRKQGTRLIEYHCIESC